MTFAVGLPRALAGAVFLAAGAGKIASEQPVRLAPVILGDASSPLVLATTVIEDALPALEILTGFAYLAGIGRMARTTIGLVLGALFLSAALLLPEGVRCGCFGILGDLEGRAGHVATAAGVLALLTAVGWLESRAMRRRAIHFDTMGHERPHPQPRDS